MDNEPVATSPRPSAATAQPWIITLTVVLVRLVMGATFAFSGFAKAIDPWGTYYKITEYILTLGWDALLPAALFAAFALPAAEMTLGVIVAVGAYRRSAPVLMLLMMAVMLPLTLWLAVTRAVPDCGCFGDAWVLSNNATFAKNVVLAVGAV
ncbi:MAG: DoxX family membrane protein, partial [Muribaculaceae bacterium]|nr:DoxX family membrane protein [Muribaculaceae bacterium]